MKALRTKILCIERVNNGYIVAEERTSEDRENGRTNESVFGDGEHLSAYIKEWADLIEKEQK